ncbi:hypothetical protein HMPREF0762_01615 [Slackia exigua ATCC 700122]|uniref:Uncharacterized protein n=1 Tax=Slackia exigua (strain ATCC 700122 / DSM 15923 / CIP 105133 / JCM 11022 / KCTC 5966 / S-7) TaxID=649764 RepID=D0WIE0_SLAES|nr:hypothetical protein HMPREF0762_01615 [Slackia exigua ATCC 700122]
MPYKKRSCGSSSISIIAGPRARGFLFPHHVFPLFAQLCFAAGEGLSFRGHVMGRHARSDADSVAPSVSEVFVFRFSRGQMHGGRL